MAEVRSDGTLGMPPMWRYTNGPEEFAGAGDLPLFHVNMDTWYYSEWADPNHRATLGTVTLGDGPLTPTQGVAAFVAQQVAAFLDAFSGVFRPIGVRVGFEPRLTGVQLHLKDFPVPETAEDLQVLQNAVDRSLDAYEGITSFGIDFAMRATVRDGHGQIAQVWLPYAGEASYSAHHTDGYISNLPRSVAVTYLLTPAAREGIGQWTVELNCNFISLFREDNSEVLARVRSRWQHWLRTHPIGAELDDEDDSEYQEEDFFVTLAVPPPGTPPDNRALCAYNTPRLRAAVARWEDRLDTPFQWAVNL